MRFFNQTRACEIDYYDAKIRYYMDQLGQLSSADSPYDDFLFDNKKAVTSIIRKITKGLRLNRKAGGSGHLDSIFSNIVLMSKTLFSDTTMLKKLSRFYVPIIAYTNKHFTSIMLDFFDPLFTMVLTTDVMYGDYYDRLKDSEKKALFQDIYHHAIKPNNLSITDFSGYVDYMTCLMESGFFQDRFTGQRPGFVKHLPASKFIPPLERLKKDLVYYNQDYTHDEL